MRIAIFDTETTNLERPFCYNIGYVIFDTETGENLVEKDFVVEQIWHNIPLFSSAYYADKRPIYVDRMRARKTFLKKYGHITQEMCRDFKNFDVVGAYAYNSPFDEKVFNFNCDWYKCINPFDNIPIFDIRGYVHNKIAFTADYQAFCEANQLFTESGNYSTTAEALFKYISKQIDFEEEHTALSDSKIETEILKYCVSLGAEYHTMYKVYRSVPRKVDKMMNVYINGELESTYTYSKRTNRGTDVYLTD
jgi:hypothetical protein